ncbi:MAG: helix-turn-helix transcriptional regulator [Pseudodesulfovibrio sp.]|nr:helix-turn-helix transcriptional regulator [Pseudodesulfovibrio sp.]
MLSAEQKIKEEIGIYLSIVRRRKGLTQEKIAKRLGHSGPNFVSRVEKGKAVIPIGKIGEFSKAYKLPVAPFGRLILSRIYPEAYETLIAILQTDEAFAKAANLCHTTGKPKLRQKRRHHLAAEIQNNDLIEMRDFISENFEFVPDDVWANRPVELTSIGDIE